MLLSLKSFSLCSQNASSLSFLHPQQKQTRSGLDPKPSPIPKYVTRRVVEARGNPRHHTIGCFDVGRCDVQDLNARPSNLKGRILKTRSPVAMAKHQKQVTPAWRERTRVRKVHHLERGYGHQRRVVDRQQAHAAHARKPAARREANPDLDEQRSQRLRLHEQHRGVGAWIEKGVPVLRTALPSLASNVRHGHDSLRTQIGLVAEHLLPPFVFARPSLQAKDAEVDEPCQNRARAGEP